MRSEILEMIRKIPGQYLSGEEISRRFTVSRTAVWKHIQALKSEGYDIEAHSRLGYRLRQSPDLLLPGEIEAHLKTKTLGRNIYYQAEFETSTNDVAKQMAAIGCPEGQVVVGETQKGGRGRLARNWFSPYSKGIWFSIVLRPNFRLQDAPKCTMMAAVAINRAIKKVANINSGIKWPNDIMFGGKKLVGILTEMSAEVDVINYVIIGVGINVNISNDDFPSELQMVATSLMLATGTSVSRLELLLAVLVELEIVYNEAVEHGFSRILDQWRTQSVTLGRNVDVYGFGSSFSGLALDIDDDGALLVQTDNGVEKVVAGDVSIRARDSDGA
ncbi:MAG: BirA bifunctional protein, biotin operon repressor and biotin/acetyl-CoA-carboxylase ligase [Firmicutes bacterium]|nr:BirA bifunctional protein, biotin operon repressor and biotin/acetyl-CoA-carboxylase ligase [Bacillota bacterium]